MLKKILQSRKSINIFHGINVFSLCLVTLSMEWKDSHLAELNFVLSRSEVNYIRSIITQLCKRSIITHLFY